MFRSAIKRIYFSLLRIFPLTRIVYETRETQTPVSFSQIFKYKVLRLGKGVYWPVHPSSKIANFRNIHIGIETSPGLMPGCYIQGNGKVYIGDYTQIGPGVGIISANHDVYDTRKSIFTEVNIGQYCWLGMNSVILPSVTLGNFTIVGSGAVVTKSFPEGHCIIAGNPAKIIRKLEPEKCVRFESVHKYRGYIKAEDFQRFSVKNLN